MLQTCLRSFAALLVSASLFVVPEMLLAQVGGAKPIAPAAPARPGVASPTPAGTPTPAVAPAPPSEGDQLMKQAPLMATAAQTEADFNKLMEHCDKALAANPSPKNQAYATNLKAWSLSKRGELKIKAEKYPEALADFTASIELDPKRWKAYYNRGTQLAREGKYEESIADLNKTIELNPGNNDAWFNRAELHAAKSEWKEAVADYNEAIRLAPTDPIAYASRADAYMQLNNYKQAVTDFSKAIDLKPEDAVLYARRATIAWQQGEYPLAVNDYRWSMTLDEKLGPAYVGAAWMMATCADSRYREPAKALQAAQKAIEFDGDKDYRYLETLAAAQAANGKFDDAAATQEKAIAAAPEAQREAQTKRLELFKSGKPYIEGRQFALPSSVALKAPDPSMASGSPGSFDNPGLPISSGARINAGTQFNPSAPQFQPGQPNPAGVRPRRQ